MLSVTGSASTARLIKKAQLRYRGTKASNLAQQEAQHAPLLPDSVDSSDVPIRRILGTVLFDLKHEEEPIMPRLHYAVESENSGE
jgi:hypothetical protein